MTFVNGYTPVSPTFDPTAYTTTAPMSSATAPSAPSNPSSFYTSPTAPGTSGTAAPGAPAAPNLGSSTAGIYVAIATIGGILVSGTQLAPIACGLLGVALIFQIQGILTGG